MNYDIIPMTADHLDDVAEIERRCFSDPWSRRMLAEHLENEDKKILETATELSENSDYDFEKAFSDLFEWCKRNLQD